MKLDKHDFARLISHIQMYLSTGRQKLTSYDIEDIDNIIDFDVPEKAGINELDDLHELLFQIINPNGFIPAIKAYRALTGAGLKESKEVIERYRVTKPIDNGHKDNGEATLGDILHASGRTKAGNNIG